MSKYRPTGVTLIAALFLIVGGLNILGAILLILSSIVALVYSFTQVGMPTNWIVDLALRLLLLICGIINFAIGWGLWKLRQWARVVIIIIFNGLGLLVIITLLIQITSRPFVGFGAILVPLIIGAISGAIILYLLQPHVRECFDAPDRRQIITRDLAVAGMFGALSIVLAATPLGMIPVPNMSGAATTLHIPAIIAGIVAGPIVGAMVGLVLAFTSWYYYSAIFLNFMGGNLLFALIDAFLPRILIGVLAYYAYRLLRRWPNVASGVAGLVGTLTNSIGVLGLLLLLGATEAATLVPVILINVPFEIILAIVLTIPVVANLRAARRGQIASVQD